MQRRSTLKYLMGGGVVAAFGGGYHWLTVERYHADLDLDLALERLRVFELENAETSGEWKITRTLNHLAQSVEFSMDGFPKLKPDLFRSTVGQLAFSVFQARGQMTHGLDEEIPGEIVDDSDPKVARTRLISALERFNTFDGQLMPHFAYGVLNKTQYSIAHVMHINDHLEVDRSS